MQRKYPYRFRNHLHRIHQHKSKYTYLFHQYKFQSFGMDYLHIHQYLHDQITKLSFKKKKLDSIHTVFAIISIISISTSACIHINSISTSSTVFAWIRCTFINICANKLQNLVSEKIFIFMDSIHTVFAIISIISINTSASIHINSISTTSTVFAWIRCTFINICSNKLQIFSRKKTKEKIYIYLYLCSIHTVFAIISIISINTSANIHINSISTTSTVFAWIRCTFINI